ncbi:hypothetical protein [Ruminococcus sp.]|uniref:hypothetical protein n=1 Tax=Ruminococcus sp. TaxID=41978 RepID=UPI0025E6A0CC|nr:hypothetical protein [Ruminococcus sp.]MCR4639155.1 hypothetical protein [Ruminococcus sp.]
MSYLISDKYKEWEKLCDERFIRLKQNEEKLNGFFIDLYDISDELQPQEADSDITIRRADLQREIKSLISYAVGCIFGRYSLDREGLCFAGGKWDSSAYKTIIPCNDNIMTLNKINYGMTAAIIDFIEKVYGSDTLEENLDFIAKVLGGCYDSRKTIHDYLQKSFFADHSKIYKKRPIYWQFTSGRKGAFRALMYIHRYDENLLSVLEKKYALPYYDELKDELHRLNKGFISAPKNEKPKLRRDISRIQALLLEMEGFLQRLHQMSDPPIYLDLDDGVKVNYEKLKSILV